MATKTALLVVACLAAAAISAHGSVPMQFPPTLGMNRYEQPFAVNDAFNNPHTAWNYYVFAVCGYAPWIKSRFEDAVSEKAGGKKNLKTWEQFLATDDATEEHQNIQLPVCQHGDELADMGINVSVQVFMIYCVDSTVLKIVKELANKDIRMQMTPAREIGIRKDIRHRLYDQALKFMDNGPGITHDGPSLAPRLLRYLFHDALDFKNIVMFNGTNARFPQDFSDDFLANSFLSSPDREHGGALKNMLVKPKFRQNIGGVDGCVLDPMELSLPQSFVDEVRGESPLPFFNSASPHPTPDQNIGFAMINDNGYRGTVSSSKAAHHLLSDVDLMILTTAFGLEQFFMSPPLPLTYGRRDRWGLKNCDLKNGYMMNLQTSIVNSWDPEATEYNFKMFKHIGFGSKKKVAALMGAHSVGQIQPCNTGDSGFGNAFCKAEAQYLASQGYKVQNMKPNYDDDISIPVPGSFFDTTPESFDNDYYKILKTANSERLKNNPDANPSGYLGCGGKQSLHCEMDTCARTFSEAKFIVFPNITGFANSYTKRVALSASEVVMMDNKKYKKSVNKLAKNNDKFRDSFVDAWTTLVDIGHWPEELYSVPPDPCTVSVSEDSATATCGTPTAANEIDEITMLTINLAECSIQTEGMSDFASVTLDQLATAAPCMLTGAYGTNLANLKCDGLPGKVLLCPV